MALTQLSPPFPIFTDRTGRPLDGGYLYFGEVDQDPETAPITVYFDSALTQPAVQPLRTSAGYVMRDNAPALLYADGKFSVTVKDKQERLVIYAPSTFGLFDETGLLFAENNLSDVDDAATARANLGVTAANLGVTIATKAQAEAGTDNTTFMTPLRTREASGLQEIAVVPAESGTNVDILNLPVGRPLVFVFNCINNNSTNPTTRLNFKASTNNGSTFASSGLIFSAAADWKNTPVGLRGTLKTYPYNGGLYEFYTDSTSNENVFSSPILSFEFLSGASAIPPNMNAIRFEWGSGSFAPSNSTNSLAGNILVYEAR